MDPGGSELDASLPQSENPCLIVEDSQPDSVALEDDPEGSYRAVLARRLSSLQPSARSPVLELISSPLGIKNSQSDSQSESSQGNNQEESDVLMATDPRSAFQEESQVLCPPAVKQKCSLEDTDMEPGADSTTHCVQAEGGTSQFSLMELSQSQDLCGEATNSHRGDKDDVASKPDERPTKSAAEQNCRMADSRDNKTARSEVSSSSSSESPAQSGRQLSIQVLLHSQGPQASQQDSDILSSQEDLFDSDKTGATVDSTVSEPEQPLPPSPTATPARSLHLLHLSGQGTLVQQSLSQSSVDYVAPSQDNFPDTPLIVPNSPTGAENEHGGDEAMDTSLAPDDRLTQEPMDTDSVSKPLPSVSTPVSQNSPGFVLERSLSVPSQPEFSHDVFDPTQSQEAAQQSKKDNTSPPHESPSQCLDSAPFMSPMQLSMNTQNSCAAGLSSQHCEDDSQATQIEEEEPPAVDTSDLATSRKDQRSNGIPSDSQSAASSKSEAPKHCGKQAESKPSVPSLKTSSNAENVNVKDGGSDVAPSSPPRSNSADLTVNSCVEETPPNSSASQSMICQTSAHTVKSSSSQPSSQKCKTIGHSQTVGDTMEEEVEEKEVTEQESTMGGGASGLALALSQSQQLSPEPMEEDGEDGDVDSVIMVTDSERESQLPPRDVRRWPKTDSSQPVRGPQAVSANGHESQLQEKKVTSDRLPQTGRAEPEPEGLKDKSLSDSSGDISFHFTLPKDGELLGPAVGATPPLINQLKQSLRHSTPIEITSFSEKSDVAGDVSAASTIVAGDSGEDTVGKGGDGKLSLRMKLVTPVEEVCSDRFSLQKPTLSPQDGPAVKDAPAAVTSSPSVFSRVRQVHRQQEEEDATPVRGELFASSPLRNSQASSLGCNSLPNSQSEAPQQDVCAAQQEQLEVSAVEDGRGAAGAPEALTPIRTDGRTRVSAPSSKFHQRSVSQQTSFEAPPTPLRSPTGRGERESPSSRRAAGPAHRRHVRTIQEVRTTITRIITDVYYEDGKEVERKVSEESEEPVVDCQVLDSDISPCRTGNSSVTSGDLADISSLSSKASSLQHSSGGTGSSGGFPRPDFVMPLSRGAKSLRGGITSVQRLGAFDQPQSSSEDEPYTRTLPPRLPVSPTDAEPPGHSDSLRSSEEDACLAGSSFVGLRVVAKWSSNGYFYSGRIIKDAGEQRFRLRFDDGYECEVAGKDILLCDPIPLETEVTALLEDEYFSVGVIKGHKTEGQDLFYSVERDGQRQWYNRTAVILSLEQGNKLREQHSLGPYEPSTPLAKASDISLDNLVEGKRRRKGAAENTPNRSSSSNSPRTPGPSGKRKLMTSEDDDSRTPAKRGRRGPGARAGTETRSPNP